MLILLFLLSIFLQAEATLYSDGRSQGGVRSQDEIALRNDLSQVEESLEAMLRNRARNPGLYQGPINDLLDAYDDWPGENVPFLVLSLYNRFNQDLNGVGVQLPPLNRLDDDVRFNAEDFLQLGLAANGEPLTPLARDFLPFFVDEIAISRSGEQLGANTPSEPIDVVGLPEGSANVIPFQGTPLFQRDEQRVAPLSPSRSPLPFNEELVIEGSSPSRVANTLSTPSRSPASGLSSIAANLLVTPSNQAQAPRSLLPSSPLLSPVFDRTRTAQEAELSDSDRPARRRRLAPRSLFGDDTGSATLPFRPDDTDGPSGSSMQVFE